MPNVKTTNELVINEKTIRSREFEYEYRLYVKRSDNVASFKLPLYSISVDMTDIDGNVSSSRISDVFSDLNQASSFFKKLYENLATPLNLPYIFEDEFMK